MRITDLFDRTREAARKPLLGLLTRTSPSGRIAPSPKEGPIGGHFLRFRRDPLHFTVATRNEVGDIARVRFGWLTAHLLSHPDHVRHVMIEHQKNYDKGTRGFDKIRTVLGNGLLTSEGSFWLRQRRIAQPAFHKERLAGFAETMARVTEEQIAGWSSGSELDMSREMMRLTLRIAGLTLLSTDAASDADRVGQALGLVLGEAQRRILSPFDWEKLPTPTNIRLKRAISDLDAVVMTIIENRRRAAERPNDLLTLFMEARDEETGEAMNDRQLRDEVLTMFLAGHETTANALAWALYLASIHPGEADKVRAEVRAVVGSGRVKAEHLGDLVLTKRFLQEVMRLYPPAWIIGRRAVTADEIGGYEIPEGSLVFLSPWVIHRHPSFFPNPEGFDPERFAPQTFAALPKTAYFPFGAGPRVCIGQGFAMMELTLVLATILSRFRLDLAPTAQVVPQPTITLRPKKGIPMTVHPA